MPDKNDKCYFPSKNSSSVAFYKKYRSVLQWRTEKKFLDLGLETAPKMYTHNIDDPSITMEFIPGVTPHSLGEGWFEVFRRQVKELNEVADPDGWWAFSNGPHYHIRENMTKVSYVRNKIGNTEMIQEITREMSLEVKRLSNMKWNNDNMIIGSFDYGPHNTLCHNGEYRLIDFEYVSHLELSTFAAKVWQQTHRHYWNMFRAPEDDSKLIEELSQYQVNDAWIEQYHEVKRIWSLQDKLWELVHNRH